MFSTLLSRLSHLPVTTIVDDVANCFCDPSQTTIVTAEVASGKTMLVPAACANLLSEVDDGEPIWVLEPSRTLANNAMDNLLQILGPKAEDWVGCVMSGRNGDIRRLRPTNRIIFTTVGYMLASRLIMKARNIIIDEAHDTTIDLSLIKALILRRREQGEVVRLALMSATIDKDVETAYWGKTTTQTFHTTGTCFKTTMVQENLSVPDGVLRLITEHSKVGIMVFVSGVGEITEAADEIEERLRAETDFVFEIHELHGKSDPQDRILCSAIPDPGIVKILIGTNVMESGVSYPWVDAGVSSGRTKISTTQGFSQIHRLEERDLPCWRIEQQAGRTNRFQDSIFILASPVSLASRPMMQIPEIQRLPLTDLVLQAAKLKVPLLDLKFNAEETPAHDDLIRAVTVLRSLGFITCKDLWPSQDIAIELTEDGEMIQTLPLSFRAAAAFCQAKDLGIVEDALPLIAMLDCTDIRRSFKDPLGVRAHCTQSDPINTVMVAARVLEQLVIHKSKTTCEENNVSFLRIKEYEEVLNSIIRSGHASTYNFEIYLERDIDPEFLSLLKIVILRAYADQCYPSKGLSIDFVKGFHRQMISVGNMSVVNFSNATDVVAATTTLRTITPKQGRSFTVAEQVTVITRDEFENAGIYIAPDQLLNCTSLCKAPTPVVVQPEPVRQESLPTLRSLAVAKRAMQTTPTLPPFVIQQSTAQRADTDSAFAQAFAKAAAAR